MSRTSLVIVESPAKCKKIEAYLGGGYKVMATFGHLRFINSLEDIDVSNHFKTKFTLINEQIKLKQVEKLRTEINSAFEVILACDGDREGEGICWHICDLFGLPIDKTKRIIFTEITESAIMKSVLNPSRINMNLVYAQQSRQILDMLVGYNVSPILWKCISKRYDNSLSAGRCQSPALRLVYDNYNEINNFPGKIVYKTIGYFTNLNLDFELNKQFENEENVNVFLNGLSTNKFVSLISNPKKVIKKSPEPLTTSLLQQLVSNELHWSPKETMKYAQQLYENGYITYMRTDSKKYSIEFIEKTKEYIKNKWSNEYVSLAIDKLVMENKKEEQVNKKELLNKLKKGPSLVQEAHEAIRPVNINIIEIDEKNVEPKAIKLYKIIWTTSIQSCMSSAQYNSITAKIDAPMNTYFAYKAEQLVFPGWQITEQKMIEKTKSEANIYQYLIMIKEGTELVPKKVVSKYTVVEQKSHYTEARLVQLLEEKGIGRPSTFASLIDKLLERKYVEKKNIDGKEIINKDFTYENGVINEKEDKRIFGSEKNKLVIQPLGIIVIEFLIDKFGSFFNYDYTKEMEINLDKIANGEMEWISICDECFKNLLVLTQGLDTTKFNIQIDENHSIIIAKYGPVIKCIDSKGNISFLPLKKGLDIKIIEKMDKILLEDLVDNNVKSNEAIGKYKGQDLFIKNGKYGIYAQWGKENKSLKEEFDNIPLDKINYIDVLRFLEKDKGLDPTKPVGLIRELTKELSIRVGKYGDYIYYKKFNARKPEDKKPKFFDLRTFKEDYKLCDKDLLINWINITYLQEKEKEQSKTIQKKK
jgi:DNA topoisomerase-1